MGLFSQRKPRGFRHEYVYVDERKDRLKVIEERAKAELGMKVAVGDGHERLGNRSNARARIQLEG